MSYSITVVASPIPADDAQAWALLDTIVDDVGPVPDVLRQLHDRLTAKYPCISTLPDDQLDGGVWSMGPLWSAFGHQTAGLSLSFSRVAEVLPFIIRTASSLNLAVFDAQTNQIHRYDGLPNYVLTVEKQPPLLAPTLPQILAAVDKLTPKGGPGFLVVDGPGGMYTQIAGGHDALTVEWRSTSTNQFQHYVAGIAGKNVDRDIKIPTNGFVITVKENEKLLPSDAKTILVAFAQNKHRPLSYVWRDITSRFI